MTLAPDDSFWIALESSGPLGSVAVAMGSDVLGRVFLDERRAHAGRMVPALDEALEDGGVLREELAGVVVGAGPGSFTGVRVAAATAKGLAHALSIPLCPVSSLAAAAATDLALPPGVGTWNVPMELVGTATAPSAAIPRYVLFDARGDRVYAGCYRLSPRFETVIRPWAATVQEVLEGPMPDQVVFLGDGAVRHRDRLLAAGHPVLPPPAGVATADGLLHVAGAEGGPGPVSDPWSWEPDYVRPAGAERSRHG